MENKKQLNTIKEIQKPKTLEEANAEIAEKDIQKILSDEDNMLNDKIAQIQTIPPTQSSQIERLGGSIEEAENRAKEINEKVENIKVELKKQRGKIFTKVNKIERKQYQEATLNEFVKKILEKYNYDDIYVSFRTDIYTTEINKNNPLNDTPIGFYCYPLKAIAWYEHFHGRNFFKKKTKDFTYDTFINNLPHQFLNGVKPKYLKFFATKEKEGIITEKNKRKDLMPYAQKIKELFGNIPEVNFLCDEFLSHKMNAEFYPRNKRERRGEDGYKASQEKFGKNEAHYFWLFLNKISKILSKSKEFKKDISPTHEIEFEENGDSSEIINNINPQLIFGDICRRIGINGFMDEGTRYMHSGEPIQALFFKVKDIGETFDYKIKDGDKENIGEVIDSVIKELAFNPNPDFEKLRKYYNELDDFQIKQFLLKKYPEEIRYFDTRRAEQLLNYRVESYRRNEGAKLNDEHIKEQALSRLIKYMRAEKLDFEKIRRLYDDLDIKIIYNNILSKYPDEEKHLSKEKAYELKEHRDLIFGRKFNW